MINKLHRFEAYWHLIPRNERNNRKTKAKRKEGIAMDNQHKKIKGYRELTQTEIDLMNEVKAKGVELGELVEKLINADGLDKRWISIGKTDLQTGLMALVRGIAQPETF